MCCLITPMNIVIPFIFLIIPPDNVLFVRHAALMAEKNVGSVRDPDRPNEFWVA